MIILNRHTILFFCSDVGERFEISLFVKSFELGAHLNVLSRDGGWGEGSGQLAFPNAHLQTMS